MNKKRILLGLSGLVVAGFTLIAADHIDAPEVTGGSNDITDFYAFEAANKDNMVFVANVQGLLSPEASKTASFAENALVEINIDNDGDNIEDLVIQAIFKDGKMYFFGPVAPNTTGLNSQIETAAELKGEVAITPYGTAAITASVDGATYFAGPRDDPFFFDFGQYSAIIAGTATGFNSPGSDTFAGTNVLSIVVEVPKSTLGDAATINAWVESKSKI